VQVVEEEKEILMTDFKRSVDDWKVKRKGADELEETIVKRLHEIIVLVINTLNKAGYKKNNHTWYFEDAPEGGMGNLKIRDGQIDYIFYANSGYPSADTGQWDYTQSIPEAFLYMTDSEIVEHLRGEQEQTAAYEAEKERKKAEKARKKAEWEASKEKENLLKEKEEIEKRLAEIG
jgi:hypothetical protein